MEISDIPEKLDDMLSMDDELKEVLPFVKIIFKAYRWGRKKRIELFLKTLNYQMEKWGEKKRERFKSYIQSDIGQELLSDYGDTVLNTSSSIVQAALAILYSDGSNEKYPSQFKLIACLALKGCTDTLVRFFLVLTSAKLDQRDEQPYPMFFLRKNDFDRSSKISELVGNAESMFTIINDLIQRGMLLPDHTSARMRDPDNWSCPFGKSQNTIMFQSLLVEAKRIIDK